MQPVIDIHIHIMPLYMLKPGALELIQRGRKNFAEIERYSAEPKGFLARLDALWRGWMTLGAATLEPFLQGRNLKFEI